MRDWATTPIARYRHEALLDPPNLQILAESLITEAGPGVKVTAGKVVEWLREACFGVADETLRNARSASIADLLPTIRRRPDYEDSMFFDFLTMQGPMGGAAQNYIIEFLTSDLNRERWIARIRRP